MILTAAYNMSALCGFSAEKPKCTVRCKYNVRTAFLAIVIILTEAYNVSTLCGFSAENINSLYGVSIMCVPPTRSLP